MSMLVRETAAQDCNEGITANRMGQFPELLASRFLGKNLPNAMTVDVEEYFQVSAFDSIFSRADWPSIPSRLVYAMDKILDLFSEHDAKATFFTLGWILERHPSVIRRLADEGHEVASHGHDHQRVTAIGRKAFRRDVEETRKRLEDVSGTSVVGYRAPSFSIGAEMAWAYEELAEAGYAYSSSVFPIRHDHYGSPDAPRFPYTPTAGGVIEIPMSTVPLLGRNWPCSGGGYFRLLPVGYSKWAVRRINRRDQMPAIFYCHPWEIDVEQPRVPGISARTRFRHYVNLAKFESRLTEMLRNFAWDRMDKIFLGQA